MTDWLIVSIPEWTALIRAELDTETDLSIDYDGTIDGAWTQAGGTVAGRAAQYFADGISAMTLATSPAVVVATRAEDRGLTPRAATFTSFTVRLETGAGGVLPVGTILRVKAGTVTDEQETGTMLPFLGSEWEVVENLQTDELLAPSDPVIVQCTTSGRVLVSIPLDLEPFPTIPGVEILRYDGTPDPSFGRVAERTSELRERVAAARANISGTDAGIVTGLLQNLSWLVAAGVVSTPGYVEVSVAPEPPTDADEEALAQNIYDLRSAGTGTIGSESRVIAGADGRPVTVNWNVGDTTAVDVAMTITPAAGVTQADADTIARDAIRSVFSGLIPGQTLLYVRAYGALNQASINGAVLTLNGGTADVMPAATNILVVNFV